MKHLTLLLIVCIICIQTTQAQQTSHIATDSTAQYQYYIKKRNTNNNAGFVCLVTGLTVGLVGAIELAGASVTKHTDAYKRNANATFIAGNVIMLASIPFYIAANNYKKKATLSLGSDAIMINDKPVPNTSYAKLSLILRL